MGYYGLGPGMRVPDQLSEFEKALRNLPVELAYQTLDILEKLLKNIAQNPKEEKFRKIKLENAKISAAITSLIPACRILIECGFVYQGGEKVFQLPMNRAITFPEHVAKIVDVKDWYKKEIEKDRVARGLSRVAPAGTVMKDPRSETEVAESSAKTLAWLAGH